MVTTRAATAVAVPPAVPPTDAEVLDHLLEAIVGFPSGSEVHQALATNLVRSVRDVLMLDESDFSVMMFRSPGLSPTDPPDSLLSFMSVAKLKKLAPFTVALCQVRNCVMFLKCRVAGCVGSRLGRFSQ
jgi:hypothetical protein